VIGHCPIAMKQNIAKQLCVCVAMYELLTVWFALELALPEEEIPIHMHSTQYQFKCSKMSIFHVITQAPFEQGRDVAS